jgi:radical SAM superfamily enzyme YgiQ (UPF0313 family)
MKKLLLVNPVGQSSGYLLSKFSTIPPLSLAYIAAATPSDWEIKIADENFSRLVFEDADLVGISAFTSNINRAYEIAGIYRKQGIKVVIGGIHASMLPDEALQYADAVVVGEAELIWKKVLEDYDNNRLRGKYSGPRVDLSQSTIKPRRDLMDSRYVFQSIQTSRGCPFDCNYCTVSKYLGKEYRQRSAQDVLDELQEIEGEYLFFLDDNLIGHSPKSIKRTKDIFAGMIELRLKKKWWMQTSIDSIKDQEVLKLAAKAGCMFAFIGFETINEKTLQDMKKGINLKIGIENYKNVVNVLHSHGIGVVGAFIIGNDYESPSYYKHLAKFLVRSGIDVVQMAILTPLPGTEFMAQMEKQDRLLYRNFPEDWDKYRLSYVVRKPEGIEPDIIYIGDNYVKNHIYGFPWNPYRTIKSFISMKNPINSYAVYRFNKALKKSWQGSHYFQKYPAKFPKNPSKQAGFDN